MRGLLKIQLYVILTVFSYCAVIGSEFKEYLKPAARHILYLNGAFSFPYYLYMAFFGIAALLIVPFIKKKRLLLLVSLACQFSPFLLALFSRDLNTFSNPSFYVAAPLYLIFATLTTIAVFQNNSIPEQRTIFQR